MESAISETTSYDAMLKALQRLKQLEKLEGTVVIKSGDCLSSDTLFGERQVDDYVLQIKALLAQYRNSGNPLNRALFNFEGGSFIIFCVSSYVFSFFFGSADDAVAVEKAGEVFIEEWKRSLDITNDSEIKLPELIVEIEPEENEEGADQSEIASQDSVGFDTNESMERPLAALDSSEVDARFKGEVKSLFVSVLGPKQVDQLLDPEWKAIKAIPYDSRKDPVEKTFGQSLLSRIRDRRIRKRIGGALVELGHTYYGPRRGASRS